METPNSGLYTLGEAASLEVRAADSVNSQAQLEYGSHYLYPIVALLISDIMPSPTARITLERIVADMIFI